MTTPPCLAGLLVPTHATVDELLVHAFFAARIPPDGHPWSDLMNNPSAITPSPSKISAPQTREGHTHGPSCDEQPLARPSPDATTTTATIARGPPQHDNSDNDKALAQTRASYVSISFDVRDSLATSCSERTTAMSDYSIPIPPHNSHRHGTPLDLKEKSAIVSHACMCPAPRFLVRHTLRGMAAGVIHE
jgi:hypothetical protein